MHLGYNRILYRQTSFEDRMSLEICVLITILKLMLCASEFIAYDCGMSNGKLNANFSEISLKSVKKCAYTAQSYNDAEVVVMQVLKRVEEHQMNAINCDVKIKLKVSAWGWDGVYSYIYQAVEIVNEHSFKISSKKCFDIMNRNSVEIDLGDNIKFKWTQPVTSYVGSSVIRGSMSAQKGTCIGEDFKFEGSQYKNSILILEHAITQRNETVFYDVQRDDIIVPGKLHSSAKLGYTYDISHGVYVWNYDEIPKEECELYQEVVKGEANKYEPREKDLDPIVILEDMKRKRQAAFLIKGSITFCNVQGYSTQVENIFIIIESEEKNLAKFKPIESSNVDKFINLKSLLSLTYLSQEIRLSRAFNKISEQICKSNKNRLEEMIRVFPKLEAPIGSQIEGVLTLQAGSVAYLFICNPVKVSLRTNILECAQEIPVTMNIGDENKTIELFADPINLILQPNSTVVPCSHIAPVKWAIPIDNDMTKKNYEWVCSSPAIHRCSKPMELNPLISKEKLYGAKSGQLSLNFFSPTQMREVERFRLFGITRRSVSARISEIVERGSSYNVPDALLMAMSSEGRQRIINFATPSFIGFVYGIWDWLSYLLVACFATHLFLGLCLLITRLCRMYKVKGVSWKLIASFSLQLFLSLYPFEYNDRCPCSDFSNDEIIRLRGILQNGNLIEE